MNDLLDLHTIINASTAVGAVPIDTGVVGSPDTAAASCTWHAYGPYKNISEFYGNCEDLLEVIAGTINTVQVDLAVKDLPAVQPYQHPTGH